MSPSPRCYLQIFQEPLQNSNINNFFYKNWFSNQFKPFFIDMPSTTSFEKNLNLTPVTNSIPGFEFFPENFKLKALLADMKYEVCKFIAEATELRNFLASKPKTMG